MQIGHRKETGKVTILVIPLSEQMDEYRLDVLFRQKDGTPLLVGAWQREKQQNK